MNKTTLFILFACFYVCMHSNLHAQLVQVNNASDAESNFSPEKLISDVLITGVCSAASNFSATVTGSPTSQDTKNYGYFKRLPGSNFPFEEGVILSTGIANQVGTPVSLMSTATSGVSDPDISSTLGLNPARVNDACIMEFDFVPKSTKISFRYLMASEEYSSNYPCSFADSFAFLLRKKSDATYQNIAVLPGTTTPVSVTNVHAAVAATPTTSGCSAQNENYFHGSDNGETNFDGRTVVLKAEATVVPNEVYHIKLVVVDFTDRLFDTAVFLEKGSFNLGLDLGPDATIAGNNSVCGTETLLTANVSSGTYKWLKDGVVIPGETNQTYLANLGNGTYTCEIDDGGCKDKDEITIEFSKPATSIPTISDLLSCSSSNTVNLTAKKSDVLNGQSDTEFEVLYYTDAAYTNQITAPNNYTTTSTNTTIYVRKRNITAHNCFTEGSFNVLVLPNPTPTQATDYEECDDTTNGGDTDGFFNNFILSTKDSQILGSLSPTQFNVSYHTSLSGAQTSATTDVIDKNTPYRNTSVNEQTIYVRVENALNPNCNVVSDPSSTTFKPFKLVVKTLPIIANNPAQITQCDTDSDLATTINLTKAQVSISNDHLTQTFKYYTSQPNAITDTNAIADPINHPTSNGDIIWVRTTNPNGCFRISQLNIIVSFAADVAYNQEFTACDDFLDADGNDTTNNNDRDGISNFDLSPAIQNIKLLFPPAIRNDLDVLLFESVSDRNAVINQIANISNYRNTNIPATTPQNIYVKIVNKVNNNCTGLGQFTIRVNPLPDFSVTSPQITCLNNPSFIEAEMPNGNYTYEWRRNNVLIPGQNTERLNVTQGGTYKVTAINTTTSCRRSETIIVNESIIANIGHDDVTIVDDSPNNSITINNNNNNLGVGDYEFALQNEQKVIVRDFQDTPFFENLSGGIYTILVRDKNNCGVAQLDVSILEFPKFFTPNNDGSNDIWAVKGISTAFYPKSNIHIFDRYGNVIVKLEVNGPGWDGLYNGKPLPSTDYWFNVQLTDTNGNIISRKGNFSLLRK